MKRLKELPSRPKPGPPPVYDFSEILDGHIWELHPGKDFECKIRSYREQLYRYCSDNEIIVTTYISTDGLLIVQRIKSQ